MHDIPDPTRLCTQQVKSSVSISSVVQDLKILQLHSGNSEVVMNAYGDALKKVKADKDLLWELSRYLLLGEPIPVVQAAVSKWLLDEHKLLRKVMAHALEKLPTNCISESSPAKKVAGSDLAKQSRLIEKKIVSTSSWRAGTVKR